MAKIIITSDKIQKLEDHFEKINYVEVLASDEIKKAQLNSAEKKAVIKRSNGQEQEVTEKMLWDEVWHLGADCEAGAYLRGKYPKVYELADAQAKAAQELRDYCVAELGIDSQRIKINDVLALTDAMIDYKLSTRSIWHVIAKKLRII
jgi:hypothetical protein